MSRHEDINLPLILSVERIGLAARYTAFVLLAPMFVMGHLGGPYRSMIVVAIFVFAHNAFVHWILYSRRYNLFLGPWNFILYFIEASVITGFTGADSSDAYILYFLILIGFSAYHRRFKLTIVVALLCCLGYGTVLFIESIQGSITESAGNLLVRFLFMIVCGWLVGSLSERLGRSETDLRTQSESLAVSEATLRTILDNAAEPILVYDEREFITEANDRAREFLGLPRDQILGHRIRGFMFDDGTLPNKFAALRASGEYRGELMFVNAEGEERTTDFRVRSYISEGQRYFVAVANDITEQKNLQQATRLANANLERLNRELRSVDQLKTTFLATISQKLRSPLSAVLGFVEMLLQEELGEITLDQRSALQTCRRATLRVFRLIDEALDLRYRDGAAKPLSANAPANGQKPEQAKQQSKGA